jgi:GNAT superfamily N-acetyltransferase
MEIKELHTVNEMLEHLDIIKQLYPDMQHDQYKSLLERMLPNSYKQVAVFHNENCVAISGFWCGTKLWCGNYIELDNIIVDEHHRSFGIGKIIQDYLQNVALETNCNILALDSYTHNHQAHKFFYNQGYGPKGFHFIKVLNENGLT